MRCRDAVQLAVAHIAELDAVAGVADIDAGAVEPDAHVRGRDVEPAVIERRQHDVVHRRARRDAGNERAHQQPRQRRVAVGEMIDVGLARAPDCRPRQAEPVEARIAGVARVGGGHRVAADREEIKRAALEAIGDLLAAAADLDEVIAIARALEDSRSFRAAVLPASGSRALSIQRRSVAPCSRPTTGNSAMNSASGLALRQPARGRRADRASRIAGDEHVAPEVSRGKNTPRDSPSEG